MICPECKTQNKEGARFCGACGSPLPEPSQGGTGSTQGMAPVVESPETETGRRTFPRAVVPIVAVALVALVACVAAWFLVGRGPAREPELAEDLPTLFSDGRPLVAGVDTVAHMRLRMPTNGKGAIVRDGNGKTVATLKATDFEDAGDGYRWAEFDVDIAGADPGVLSFSAEAADNSGGNASSGGASAGSSAGTGSNASPSSASVSSSSSSGSVNGSNNSSSSNKPDNTGNELGLSGLDIPVVPENAENPVPADSSWVLAKACDWADEHTADYASPKEAAKGLSEWLAKQAGVKTPTCYGSVVVFAVGESSHLHCVCLEPVSGGMLGSEADHRFASNGPAVQAYLAKETGEKNAEASNITSGNTVTSANVLMLNPTPSLMSDASTKKIEQACKDYSNVFGGKLETKSGDDALASVLAGDLCGKGVVVLRAHGIMAEGALTFMQVRSARKAGGDGWDKVQKDLRAYCNTFNGMAGYEAGQICFGLPEKPQTWNCAITARATGQKGEWDMGVSMTTNLIKTRYSAQSLNGVVLCISSCGGLANSSFADWAVKERKARLVLGYEGTVSEEDDATAVCELLQNLTSKSSEAWRCKNVSEALGVDPKGVVTAKLQKATVLGNGPTFSGGTGAVSGVVKNKDGSAVAGAKVAAWRYFGNGFVTEGTTTASSDGSFTIEGISCGRYVLTIESGGERGVASIVVDQERVDGGEVLLSVASKREAKPAASPAPAAATVDLGANNACVAADADWYYLGAVIGSSSNGGKPKHGVVRVSRKDESKREVLWEGEVVSSIDSARVCLIGTTIVFEPPSRHGSPIMSMKTDGSDARILVESGQDGMVNGFAFVCSKDRVFYSAASNDGWQVRSCSLDGTDNKVLCEGSAKGSTSDVRMLAVTGSKVYFSGYGTGLGGMSTVWSVPEGGGSKTEVYSNPDGDSCVLNNRIYGIEGGDLVSASLEGNDRKVVASLSQEIRRGSILNMNSRHALVNAYVDGGDKNWHVDMQTGEVTQLADSEWVGHAFSLVDDVVVVTGGGGEVERWDLNLQKQATLWSGDMASTSGRPQTEGTPASASASAATSTTATAQDGEYVLSGVVRVHEEHVYEKAVQVVSITLDKPVSYTWQYKNSDFGQEAKEVALEISTGNDANFDEWAQYDGKHITVACSSMRGAIHDASMYNVDSTAFTEKRLISVDS